MGLLLIKPAEMMLFLTGADRQESRATRTTVRFPICPLPVRLRDVRGPSAITQPLPNTRY